MCKLIPTDKEIDLVDLELNVEKLDQFVYKINPTLLSQKDLCTVIQETQSKIGEIKNIFELFLSLIKEE